MQRAVSVQFSGNAKPYNYSIEQQMAVEVGDRVVVPGKLKDDGSVSLSIATVILVGAHIPPMLPVVSVIPKALLALTAEKVKAHEGAAQ